MTPEWVAVPSLAMGRWLALELARTLGASGPSATDGVAANIVFGFPGSLRMAVLGAASAGEPDPWQVDSLVWAVLEVLHARRFDEALGPLIDLPEGATWFGRARRLADMFDRYAVRRPGLVLAWNAGHDVDGTGRLLVGHDRWQPHLWRLVRDCVGSPSPPERLPALLEAVREGTLSLELPPRLAIFGVTTLPSGTPFIELIEALSTRRELHLLALDPSPVTTSRVRRAVLERQGPVALLRAEDDSDAEVSQVHHPLLRSWGRPYRERAVLLAGSESAGVPAPVPVDEGAAEHILATSSLLSRLQRDLRQGCAPAGDFELDPQDSSIQVHSCHGQARQVQVLRDAILHLLDDDPTLREEDIVVLSPAIDQFAPLVEVGFGISSDEAAATAADTTPRLFYRVTDRSLRESHPVLAAFDSLLALISGRFGASAMLEFVSLPVVQRRFGFDDDSLAKITEWVTSTKVRWGLDGGQRAAFGLPPDFTANSWRAALDRLLMGVALSDDDLDLGPGGIAPYGVASSDIGALGRFADLVARLAKFSGDTRGSRCVLDWCEVISEAIDQFFEVDENQQWQVGQLKRILVEIGDRARVGDKPASVELSLSEMRRLLADRLQGAPVRSDFFRGGITISSLTPLRWLPFRVVCLLGLDEAGTSGAGVADGDDLAATAPLIGDHDPRSEIRQALLEAVLAAGEHLVITRSGHDVRTNRVVPYATVLAELRDTVTATLSPATRGAYSDQIEIVHPCQSFDDRCFRPGKLRPHGPWSFDAAAFAGAVARGEATANELPFMEHALKAVPGEDIVISLAELKVFFNHPVKAFLRRRLRLHLPGEDPELSDDLATSLEGLERWQVAERMLSARLAGHSTDEWERHERALGALPPGGLGEAALAKVEETVEALLSAVVELGIEAGRAERLQVSVELAGHTRLIETLIGRCAPPCPGPALVTCSKVGAKLRLAAWLDLMALVAYDPVTNWRSVLVGGPDEDTGHMSFTLAGRGVDPADRRERALAGLEVACDCYRRGMLEPLPLFASLSYKVHHNNAKEKDWRPFNGRGEGRDEANKLVLGDLGLDDLMALPARQDDPPGPSPSRVQRFADYLWGALEASSEEAG